MEEKEATIFNNSFDGMMHSYFYPYDTVPVIEEKSKVIENLDPYMKPLCELYQDVRYGDRKVNALSSEQAADLAISADETIKARYYQPKTYANSDFDFRRE
jgi:hypothetical protein